MHQNSIGYTVFILLHIMFKEYRGAVGGGGSKGSASITKSVR